MNLQKTVFLIPFLGLSLMGNKGCEQAAKQRILRMDVMIDQIRTLPLKVDQQEEIYIDQLTRELFARTIYAHNHFSVMNDTQPTTAFNSLTKTTTPQSRFTSERDRQILAHYGFDNSDSASSFKTYTTESEIPFCQWENAQLNLNSEVLGFELVDRTGIGIGFSPSGTHLDELRGRVKFINFRLDYGITAIHPLLQRLVVATETVEYKSSVELEFDFGQNAPITIDFFYQEAMTKVIKNGMKNSLDQLVTRLQEQAPSNGKDWNHDIWESRVLFDPAICNSDTCIALRGGALHRIKVGDRFNVTNRIHTWEGEPCQSRLIRSIPESSIPSEIVIESVGDTVSVGRLKGNRLNAIQPGALVKVNQLIQTK